MKVSLRILLLAMLPLSLGVAVKATRAISQAEMARAALASQEIALREKIFRLTEQLRTASDTSAATNQKVLATVEERAASEAMASGTEAAAMPATAAPLVSANTIIANDPRRMAEFKKDFRDGLDYRCAGMFSALGLSPEQIEKAKDLIVSEQQAWMDMRAAAELGGLSREGYEALKLEQIAIRRKSEAEILGPFAERFREYYHFAAPVRDLAQRLASTAAYPETSVTAAQVERVAEILTANSQRTSSGPWRGTVQPETINWEAARAELEHVLSAAQIATLGLYVQNEVAQAKVVQQVDRLTAQFKGQPPQ